MKFKTLTGREKDIPIKRYLVDWDDDQGSQFSAEVLDFLFPYWKHDVVLAELPVAGTKMRYDFVNLTKRIIVETDGVQHEDPNSHFHGGSRIIWWKQIKRDLDKDKAAQLNGFLMVRIKPSDLPLSRDWFKRVYGISL